MAFVPLLPSITSQKKEKNSDNSHFIASKFAYILKFPWFDTNDEIGIDSHGKLLENVWCSRDSSKETYFRVRLLMWWTSKKEAPLNIGIFMFD